MRALKGCHKGKIGKCNMQISGPKAEGKLTLSFWQLLLNLIKEFEVKTDNSTEQNILDLCPLTSEHDVDCVFVEA